MTPTLQIVTPSLEGVQNGNELTAVRYANHLRRLGYRVRLDTAYDGAPVDALIALHARRGYAAITRFADHSPGLPLIVVLTGTDLYRDIHVDARAQESLERATRLVVLQRMGLQELPERLRCKARVIYQSARPLKARVTLPHRAFQVSVVGHLRPEKDPFRTALAAREMPAESRLRVVHVGAALNEEMDQYARNEVAVNPRYRWLGPLRHWRARQVLAGSHVTCITSHMEGSSNVLCEALASDVPVIASRISGLVGTLGEQYPAYFPVGDTAALARVLWQMECDADYYAAVKAACAARAKLIRPEREAAAWQALLAELLPTAAVAGSLATAVSRRPWGGQHPAVRGDRRPGLGRGAGIRSREAAP